MLQGKINKEQYKDEREIVRMLVRPVQNWHRIHFNANDREKDCMILSFDQIIGKRIKNFPDVATDVFTQSGLHTDGSDLVSEENFKKFYDGAVTVLTDYDKQYKYWDFQKFLFMVKDRSKFYQGWSFDRLFAEYPFFEIYVVQNVMYYTKKMPLTDKVTPTRLKKLINTCDRVAMMHQPANMHICSRNPL